MESAGLDCGLPVAAAYDHCKQHQPFRPVSIHDGVYKALESYIKVMDVVYDPFNRDNWEGRGPL